jgi:hypothetical protein
MGHSPAQFKVANPLKLESDSGLVIKKYMHANELGGIMVKFDVIFVGEHGPI